MLIDNILIVKEELAKIFGINEKSVYNYIQAFSVWERNIFLGSKNPAKGGFS